MPNIHILKAVPPYYKDVEEGLKPFELRKNDRNFNVNDLIFLCEYFRETQKYTGHVFEARITYMFEYDTTIRGLMQGYVILGISPVGYGYIPELDGVDNIDISILKNSSGFHGMIL